MWGGTDMIFIVIMLLVLFIAALIIKPKCPDCGGKMDDVYVHDDNTVYKCRNCGEEWI